MLSQANKDNDTSFFIIAHYIMFFFYLGVSVKPLQVCWLHPVFFGGGLLFSMHFSGAFYFLDNSKFLFFSASSKRLRNSAWKVLLILLLSGTEFFISLIFLSMMANWVQFVYCFHNDSFCLKNSWYLCQEHLTNFNWLFAIWND